MRSKMRRMLSVLLSFAVLGVAQMLVAAVQNVEITAANAYAYSGRQDDEGGADRFHPGGAGGGR